MISDFDRHNVEKILRGHGTWFNAELLRLCAKADKENLEKIRAGFPDVVEAYEAWDRGEVKQDD